MIEYIQLPKINLAPNFIGPMANCTGKMGRLLNIPMVLRNGMSMAIYIEKTVRLVNILMATRIGSLMTIAYPKQNLIHIRPLALIQ